MNKKNKLKKNIIHEIEQKIDIKEEEFIKSNYKQSIEREIDELINSLHSMIEVQKRDTDKKQGSMGRRGEKCTKYFFSLERKHNINNTIKQLKREDRTLTSTNAEILEEQYKFYEKLYPKDNILDECTKNYLDKITNHKSLQEEEKHTLEGNLKDWECRNATLNMKSNKSPGLDGLPVGFYITFWNDI